MQKRALWRVILALSFSACAVFIPSRVCPASDIQVPITPKRAALGTGKEREGHGVVAAELGKAVGPRPEIEMVRWPMIGRVPHHVALTDEEIAELIAYFRAQPAVEHDIVQREAELADKNK